MSEMEDGVALSGLVGVVADDGIKLLPITNIPL